MKSRLIIFLFIVFTVDGFSQGLMEDKLLPTRQDTLRGSITPEREWWDLTYYHLDIKVEPDKKFISGSNTVGYKVLKSNKTMQIDLQEPMKITSVEANGKSLNFNDFPSASTDVIFIGFWRSICIILFDFKTL